jgi:hypothetical protein
MAYIMDDLIYDTNETGTFEDEVDKKIKLLYHFCVLKRKDQRIPMVRNMLTACCTNRDQLDDFLADIIRGRCTINELLKRKGFYDETIIANN